MYEMLQEYQDKQDTDTMAGDPLDVDKKPAVMASQTAAAGQGSTPYGAIPNGTGAGTDAGQKSAVCLVQRSPLNLITDQVIILLI